MSHGGKREGAGRKPRSIPKKAITVRVEPEVHEKFTDIRHAHGRSESAEFAEMVRKTRRPSQDAD